MFIDKKLSIVYIIVNTMTYQINIISLKTPAGFLGETEKLNLKFM